MCPFSSRALCFVLFFFLMLHKVQCVCVYMSSCISYSYGHLFLTWQLLIHYGKVCSSSYVVILDKSFKMLLIQYWTRLFSACHELIVLVKLVAILEPWRVSASCLLKVWGHVHALRLWGFQKPRKCVRFYGFLENLPAALRAADYIFD